MDTSLTPLKATVIGLTGKQGTALLREVGSEFDLHILTTEHAMGFRGNDSDVVIMTRFIGHKHERHVRRVSRCSVIVLQSGAARGVANALRSVSTNMAKGA